MPSGTIELERLSIDYNENTDEQNIAMYQAGDAKAQEYLIEKYRNFVRAKSKPYYLIGATKEDVYQEGMIGLFKAIRDYKTEKELSFISFAEICIVRQVISAIKAANRRKHSPLNFYVSLDKPVSNEENEQTLLDIVVELKSPSPEDLLIEREDNEQVQARTNQLLSPLEQEVLVLYLNGRTYQEISDNIGRPIKTIDNAIQRIKKKIEKAMQN